MTTAELHWDIDARSDPDPPFSAGTEWQVETKVSRAACTKKKKDAQTHGNNTYWGMTVTNYCFKLVFVFHCIKPGADLVHHSHAIKKQQPMQNHKAEVNINQI